MKDYNQYKRKRIFNISFGILRIYLSFLVVNTHCFDSFTFIIQNKYLLLLLVNSIHVPLFYIMSFYMCFNLFETRNINKIKSRFLRLLIPYLLWPIIIFLFNKLYNLLFGINLYTNSFKCFKFQLLTGHCSIPALWFQFNLILSTFLITVIALLLPKNKIFILINISILSYILQYSNINFNYFIKFGYYKMYTFGRFFEIMPFCISGYIMASLNVNHYLKKYRAKSIYLFSIFIIFLIKYSINTPNLLGFGYQGINLHTKSICIFILFSLFSSEKIENQIMINIIKLISKQTPGIYYLHYPMYLYLNNYILPIKKRTLFGSLIIFIICFLISLLGNKLFNNILLKHLFQ